MPAVQGQLENAPTSGTARSEEIERITRVVLAVLDAKRAQSSEQKSRAAALREFFLTHWQLTALLLSAFALAGASLIYGASPGYYFKQLAINDHELDAKEQQFAYEQGMAEKHVALGRAFLDQGLFKDAEAAFKEALEFSKISVDAQLGQFKAKFFSLSSTDQFNPAVVEQRIATVFTNSETGQIEDPHALAALGDLMFETGRTDQARARYRRAIALRPELAHAHARLADIAFQESDFAAAADAIQEAYELASSNPDYRTNLASALLYAGRHDEAVNHYQEIFKIDQEKLSPYLEYALALRLQGDFKESLSTLEYTLVFFDKALKLAKNSKSDWFFVINGSRYYLTSTEEKRGYAYRAAELSAYLADDAAARERLHKGAHGPELAIPQVVRDAILAEASELRHRQPAISRALNTFLREAGFDQ